MHIVKEHLQSLPKFGFDVIIVNIQGEEIQRKHHQASYFIENLGSSVTLDLVYIPGGTFLMGSSQEEGLEEEKPQHKVTVQPFFMGKYQVTQIQWKAIASLPRVNRDLQPYPSRFKGDNLPVEQVSWYDAFEFCQRLSKETGKEYRLPSEAEWEYACRAGTTTPFHFGKTITAKLANYRASEIYATESKGEYRRQTTPVGSFLPNAFGLYDMHGNVWEWCADDWHDNYKNAPTDSSAWIVDGDDNRSPRRGGAWNASPSYCRSVSRYNQFEQRDLRYFNFGFRIACSFGRV